jgi:hypothetical protein
MEIKPNLQVKNANTFNPIIGKRIYVIRHIKNDKIIIESFLSYFEFYNKFNTINEFENIGADGIYFIGYFDVEKYQIIDIYKQIIGATVNTETIPQTVVSMTVNYLYFIYDKMNEIHGYTQNFDDNLKNILNK